MRVLTKYGSILCSVLMLVGLTFGNPIPVGPEYDTLVDLLAHFPVSNVNSKSYIVKGRNAIGDGFEGLFYWVPNSTFATNNSTVFTWGNGRLFRMNVGSQPFTNITVINLTVTSNLFLTNMTVFETNTVINQSFTTNIVDNSVTIYTNSVFQFNGTNIATINPTIGVVPFNGNGTNFFDSPIRVLNTNTVGVDQVFTYDFGVTNLVTGGFVVSIDSGQGYGLLTNVPFSSVALWTNIAGTYFTTQNPSSIEVTNLLSDQTLTAGGALLLTYPNSPTTLFAGENDIDTTGKSVLVLSSADPTAQLRLNTGNGPIQELLIYHAGTTAFTLFNGDALYDDGTSHLYLPGGDWSPDTDGQAMFLFRTPVGWTEAARFGGPTNVITQELWQFVNGYLQPKDLTQLLFWTNSATWGPGTTNVLARIDNTLLYMASDQSGPIYPYIGVTNLAEANMALFGSGGNLAVIRGSGGVSLSDSISAGNELRWFGHYWAPPSDTHAQLGGDMSSTEQPWYQVNAWTNTVYGFRSGTNYSRLAISHTGTNGAVVWDSQANGSAGAPVDFKLDWGGTNQLTIARDQSTLARVQIYNPAGNYITFGDGTNSHSVRISESSAAAVFFANGLVRLQLTNAPSDAGGVFGNEGFGATTIKDATSATPVRSPIMLWSGTGWSTNAAASQSVGFAAYTKPASGQTNPSAIWRLDQSVNGAVSNPAFGVSTEGPILLAHITKAQKTAIISPVDGMIVYQTDNTPGLRAYINGAWVILNTSADP